MNNGRYLSGSSVERNTSRTGLMLNKWHEVRKMTVSESYRIDYKHLKCSQAVNMCLEATQTLSSISSFPSNLSGPVLVPVSLSFVLVFDLPEGALGGILGILQLPQLQNWQQECP